jgi:hypothetical protein
MGARHPRDDSSSTDLDMDELPRTPIEGKELAAEGLEASGPAWRPFPVSLPPGKTADNSNADACVPALSSGDAGTVFRQAETSSTIDLPTFVDDPDDV